MDFAKKRQLSRILFGCALGVTLAIAVLYLYNIIRWANLPDYGFGYRVSRGIGVVGRVSEPGRTAGIEVGDYISKINGKSFTNFREFLNERHRELGEKNIYLVERRGKQIEFEIINTPSGIGRVLNISGFPYVVGLCYILMGVLVFLMKPHRRPSWIFFLFASILGLWLAFFVKLDIMKPFWLNTFHIFLNAFVPAVLIHLAMSFPEERKVLRKYPYSQLLPYLGSALLFLGIRSVTPILADVPMIWYLLIIAYFLIGVIFFLFCCLQSWLRSISEIAKLRSKMILLGMAIAASLPLSETIINTVFHVHLVPSFNYYLPFFVAFPIAVAYSIVKHNLFDIDGTIRRTFGYFLVTVGISAIYTLIGFMPKLTFGKFDFAGTAAFPIIFTLALLFFFNLARNRIHKIVDRVFYRLEYDYQETIQRISESMRSLLSLDQIGKKMMEIVSGVLFVDKGFVMLLNSKGEIYESLTDPPSRFTVSAHDPLIQGIAERRKEVTHYDIEENPLFEREKEICRRTLDRLEATVIVPLIYEERLTGLMSLGNKKSGKFYRQEDIHLLRTLANQAAVAIENARLYQARVEALEHSRKELERLNRVKSIALDHLSHELKTPLFVIQGNIRHLKRKLEMQTAPGEGEKSFETLERQLNRLRDIQHETDEIIRSYQELEEEPISVFSFAEQILEEVKQRASHRNIHFYLEGQKDLSVLLPPKILGDILEGLLKNAIENTPDEGMVRVVIEQKAQWILLKVQDFGVGISDENQRHLFDGLFHTQGTEDYASKKPYDFNAGGKGLNLLKMKVYSQRFGFDISVGSQRCIHLPTDRDLCPGRISLCSHCQQTSDCLPSGGSTFCVTFPIAENRMPGGNNEHGKETSSC